MEWIKSISKYNKILAEISRIKKEIREELQDLQLNDLSRLNELVKQLNDLAKQ